MNKLSASLIVAAILSAALPLSASAMSVGVSDSLSTTILSGHVSQCTSSYDLHSGTEASIQASYKVGTEQDGVAANSSVVDPAATGSANSGTFNVATSNVATTAGTYSSGNFSSSSLVGGSESQTSIDSTVSSFANP